MRKVCALLLAILTLCCYCGSAVFAQSDQPDAGHSVNVQQQEGEEIDAHNDLDLGAEVIVETDRGRIVTYAPLVFEQLPAPRLWSTRTCSVSSCNNVVTVTNPHDYVCYTHRCKAPGCWRYYYNGAYCQYHCTDLTQITCQAYVYNSATGTFGKCGKIAAPGSIFCVNDYCPKCLNQYNGTICYVCTMCTYPGCANQATCNGVCNDHCPHKCKVCHDKGNCCSCNTCSHTCKTHHVNHCPVCHNDPCTCAPIIDVTATIGAPFIINPNTGTLTAGNVSFTSRSSVPISLTAQNMTPIGAAPVLVGRDSKDWTALSVAETGKYIALGLKGNSVDVWMDGQAKSLGTIQKNATASYALQGRYGYAWREQTALSYGLTVKVTAIT